jgi:hypothetical protein
LSRACLGKMIVFIYKWLKNAVFRRHHRGAQLQVNSLVNLPLGADLSISYVDLSAYALNDPHREEAEAGHLEEQAVETTVRCGRGAGWRRRREKLRRDYHFECSCLRCTEEEEAATSTNEQQPQQPQQQDMDSLDEIASLLHQQVALSRTATGDRKWGEYLSAIELHLGALRQAHPPNGT